MPRTKGGVVTRRRHKKILSFNKGYRMTKSRLFGAGHEAYLHALEYAFRGRKMRKRDFHSLWISRINIALRNLNPKYSYSLFIRGLKDTQIKLDRKVLADLAVSDERTFSRIAEEAFQGKPQQ